MGLKMTDIGRIALDVVQDVPAQESTRLQYTEEMLAFRATVERQWAEMKKKDPDAIFDISWVETEDTWLPDDDDDDDEAT